MIWSKAFNWERVTEAWMFYLLHRRRLSSLQDVLESSCNSGIVRHGREPVVQLVAGWGRSGYRAQASISDRWLRGGLPRPLSLGALHGVLGREPGGRKNILPAGARRSRPRRMSGISESIVWIVDRWSGPASARQRRRWRTFKTCNIIPV